MSGNLLSRRDSLFAVSAAAIGTAVLAGRSLEALAANDTAIRPFKVHVPDDALADLRRRLAATRWPDKETVADPADRGPHLAISEREFEQ